MFGKTFVERRSLLTMYRTFYRVWAFLILEFHFMAVRGCRCLHRVVRAACKIERPAACAGSHRPPKCRSGCQSEGMLRGTRAVLCRGSARAPHCGFAVFLRPVGNELSLTVPTPPMPGPATAGDGVGLGCHHQRQLLPALLRRSRPRAAVPAGAVCGSLDAALAV